MNRVSRCIVVLFLFVSSVLLADAQPPKEPPGTAPTPGAPPTPTVKENFLPKFTAGDQLVKSSVFEKDGNKIGIGTTNPQARLAVRGRNTNVLIGDAGCNSPSAGIGFGSLTGCTDYALLGNPTENVTIINRPTGGRISFREANSTQMVVAPGGTVGIGTDTPYDQYKLHIRQSSPIGYGMRIDSLGTWAIWAEGRAGVSALGESDFGPIGVDAVAFGQDPDSSFGLMALAPVGYAGYFNGKVHIAGNLSKSGGSFQIDHPLDPASKYLYHSFVESPDMMNIYNGVVTLDASGQALVKLPAWFGAVNKDFRYQLTAIGAPAPNLHIAQKIADNQFRIAGGAPGIEVSWQVTGVRQDAWANAHRVQVEQDKPARERGYYLHPELFGAPPEKGIDWARHPERMKELMERKAARGRGERKP